EPRGVGGGTALRAVGAVAGGGGARGGGRGRDGTRGAPPCCRWLRRSCGSAAPSWMVIPPAFHPSSLVGVIPDGASRFISGTIDRASSPRSGPSSLRPPGFS